MGGGGCQEVGGDRMVLCWAGHGPMMCSVRERVDTRNFVVTCGVAKNKTLIKIFVSCSKFSGKMGEIVKRQFLIRPLVVDCHIQSGRGAHSSNLITQGARILSKPHLCETQPAETDNVTSRPSHRCCRPSVGFRPWPTSATMQVLGPGTPGHRPV